MKVDSKRRAADLEQSKSESEKTVVVARGWEEGNEELVFNGDRVSVSHDEMSHGGKGDDGCTTM